ncbi:MAG: hypothetical protein MUE49_00020 [Rhodospirillales bacterium]|jgi:hypothetical protein|nr:hypothetical protein [Rhodospirillales bacterium]
MSYDPSYLELWAPPAADGRQQRPEPSPGIPERLEDAGRVFSHGLLIGDLLGLDTKPAQDALDTVYGLPDDLPRLFLEDAIALLHDQFLSVAAALAEALDDGRPVGEGGARLTASPFITADSEGRLRVQSTRFPLSLLLFRINELCAILKDAISRDLLVVERYVYENTAETHSG